MSSPGLSPFALRCPEIAERETRSISVLRDEAVPIGDYVLIEYYCGDPRCDCRRVLLQVIEQHQPAAVLASISFGWAPFAYYARVLNSRSLAKNMTGPSLDPLLPQSEYAEALFELVCMLCLENRDFVQRLQNHYAAFRKNKGHTKTR